VKKLLLRWFVQTAIIISIIIIGMIYGWGLEPKSWLWVIVAYWAANGLIPSMSYLNYTIEKRWGKKDPVKEDLREMGQGIESIDAVVAMAYRRNGLLWQVIHEDIHRTRNK